MNAYSSNTVVAVSKHVAEWDEMKRAAARARKAKSRANRSSEKRMQEKAKARIYMAKIYQVSKDKRDRERAAVPAHCNRNQDMANLIEGKCIHGDGQECVRRACVRRAKKRRGEDGLHAAIYYMLSNQHEHESYEQLLESLNV